MIIYIILFVILLLIVLWTVMTTRLLRSVAGLVVTSAVLSIIMFKLDSPLAAVFELSVCAGLISVIFITTISFTERITKQRLLVRKKERWHKFWLLPFIIVIAGLLLSQYKIPMDSKLAPPARIQDVRYLFWYIRHLDLLGQVILLLAGALGVVILFKEDKK